MNGQQYNFEDIYKEFSLLVYNVSLSYLQNNEDAEEITQDVFVQVFQSIGRFEASSSLKTWIYRITINKCLDHIRAKKRKKRLAFITQIFNPHTGEALHEAVHFDHPGVALQSKERTAILFQAIASLNEQQRTAFILSQIEKLPQKEIAGIMKLSEKAVESLIQRAKTNLKKQLGDLYHNRRI